MSSDPLLDPARLLDLLSDPNVQPVDATWYFPFESRSAEGEFSAAHIPGAVRFDIDEISDRGSELPHMLPGPEAFAEAAGALGLGDDRLVVVYETTPPRSAARVWWMLRAMGHENVRVLDGGLPAWLAAGGPIETGPARPRPARFTPRPRGELVLNRQDVETHLQAGSQLLDARPLARFLGQADEPRPGVRRGRIPGSTSLPASTLFDPAGKLLPKAGLLEVMEAAGVRPDAPAAATCGSGVTACLIALAFARLGEDQVPVYDGSFAEWGRPGGPPVASGAAP